MSIKKVEQAVLETMEDLIMKYLVKNGAKPIYDNSDVGVEVDVSSYSKWDVENALYDAKEEFLANLSNAFPESSSIYRELEDYINDLKGSDF